MHLKKSFLLPVVSLFALALWGCASAPATRAAIAPGASLEMKASNFRFDPNTIAVQGTGTVTLVITNTSGAGHNITVNDPKGKVIDTVEIPPNATISTSVTFPAPGDYPFSCNHPFHASFGMTGHFIVSGG